MNRIEQELRAGLARVAEAPPPPLPGLADRVVRAGRRAHRLRVGAAAGTVAAVVVLAGAQVLRLPGDREVASAAVPAGPPTVAMVRNGGSNGDLLDWPGGTLRTRPLGDATAVGAVPSGLLLVSAGDAPRLSLLAPDADAARVVVDSLGAFAVAVAPAGDRATVVTARTPDTGTGTGTDPAAGTGTDPAAGTGTDPAAGTGEGRRLVEVQLPSGRVLRSVPIGPPLAGSGEVLLPVAYSGGAVLLTVGEGTSQRAALWEAGDDQVVAPLEGFTSALGGTSANGSGEGSAGEEAVGGRAALAVTGDDRCRVRVVELRTGLPSWRLCREPFVGFSPDGGSVLSTDAVGKGLVVRDAGDGDVRHRIDVPGGLRAYGWESATSLVYTTVDGADTLVVRCSAESGRCRTAATLPGTDRIPQPVARFER